MTRRAVGPILTWALPVAVEVALYLQYRAKDARFHWLTHFLVGGAAALLLMTLWVAAKGRPARFPLLWIVAAHLFAMFPDFLFEGGHIHQPWMDLFLWHIGSHFVPGRNVTWFAVFLAVLALHLVVLDQLARPRREAPRDGRGRATR